jgi:arylsulfatase A-like enzyme
LVPRRDFPGRHDWLRPAIRSLYLSEVVDADRRLGELLAKMEAGGLLERTLVVLTADHGEELLEHHGIGHASTTLNSAPQPELVRIPFFFRLPGGARGGARIAGRFEQVDFMPTLFGLLGLPLRQVKAGVDFDGADRSGFVLGRASGAEGRPRPTIVSSTPCGWQCSPERRGERVHARIDGDQWDWCRPPQVPCTGSLAASLAEQAQRAKLLRAE